MKNTLIPNSAQQERLEWTEPEIYELHLQETALQAGMGGDGSPFPDCTSS